jgi:hypothetical protein
LKLREEKGRRERVMKSGHDQCERSECPKSVADGRPDDVFGVLRDGNTSGTLLRQHFHLIKK